MKILYFTQFYYPENVAGSFRATDNSRFWNDAGEDVTVFTTYPNYPLGRVFDGYDSSEDLFEDHAEGVRVLRSKISIQPNTSFVKRAINAYSFKRYALKNLRRHLDVIGTDYDLIVASSGPVFVAQVGWRYAKKMHIPMVFEIRDMTFKQLVATGEREKSWKVRLMKHWELKLCNDADGIVVLTNGFKRILCENGISPDKIEVVPNGVDLKAVQPVVRASHGKEAIFGYFGTIGISQDLDTVLDYFGDLSKSMPLQLKIIGAGAQMKHVRELVDDGYPCATIEDQKPPEALEADYAMCDACVVSLKKSDSFSGTLPSKVFQIMARGIPVIFIGPCGEASELIHSNDAGIVLTGTKEEDMKTMVNFFETPDWKEELGKYGDNGRRLVVENYSREQLAERYIRFVNHVKSQRVIND